MESVYTGDTFGTNFEKLLPRIETESEQCFRLNLKRIETLRPGQKRPIGRPPKNLQPSKKQILETKKKYITIKTHFSDCHSKKTLNVEETEENDEKFATVMPLLVWYLREKDLSNLCQVSKRIAYVILNQDHRWRALMKPHNLMPISSRFKIHNGMTEYKVRLKWSSGRGVAVNRLLKFSRSDPNLSNNQVTLYRLYGVYITAFSHK